MASQYKKLTQHEHVLHRPTMYIGSNVSSEQKVWVPVSIGDDTRFELKSVQLNPGLEKIFDEAIVNAYDHTVRQKGSEYPVKTIDVVVSDDMIMVRNDGFGIPTDKHPEYGCYVPELIFGTLMTSSNYDDSQERLGAGMNGLGIKLANIFSTEFHVELVDQASGKKYTQSWSNNMRTKKEPTIKPSKLKPYTQIYWKPDLSLFGYPAGSKLTADMISVFQRKVIDIAAVLGKDVKVSWNGVKVPFKNFGSYAALYLSPEIPIVHESIHDRLEIAIAENPTKKFMQVSFVNGNLTNLGGTHVNAISKQITDYLAAVVNKKRKGKEVSDSVVENAYALFIRCDIVNPSFSSQSKEQLKTRVKDFGMNIELPESFLKKCATKLGIIAKLMLELDSKETKDAKKTDGKLTSTIRGLPKLDDAMLAGTKDSAKCTLILTEGDSAKAMVLSGLSKDQRKHFGVYPLKGKIMNVKDAAVDKIHANTEIAALKKILGLETGKTYTTANGLRYGSIMFMTDQDFDGSHIRGLGINLFHSLWKELLTIPGFITYMATPIVKATKGNDTKTFYTITDYESWKETATGSWKIKYYKGLGTSNRTEAQEYFKSLNSVAFVWNPDSDGAIDLAFNKGRADDRKDWLLKYDPTKVLNHHSKTLGYDSFVHNDLIHFSYYDLVRSIPNVMDGLKVSQRKILYAAFKKNLTKEIKVAQFAGYVSENTGYHHGEQSLNAAIVGMAQDFVGSNNLNLFKPNGQFGTRIQGGQDHASERYIFTELNNFVQPLFPADDFPVLDYTDDDGDPTEPVWYAPVIPMILVNGSDGIGTGFSTKILSYNPKDIVEHIRNRLTGKLDDSFDPIPWYNGFKGTIEKKDDEYIISGVIGKKNPTTVLVSELPVGTWTYDFKEFLESLIDKGTVKNYMDMSTDLNVHFEIVFTEPVAEPEKVLKLTTKRKITNMHVFDPAGKITKVSKPKDIVDLYYPVRMDLYKKRQVHQLKVLSDLILKHDAIVKFLTLMMEEKLVLKQRSKTDIEADLKKFGLPLIDQSYKYLLGMPFSSISKEELEKHMETAATHRKSFEILNAKTPTSLWLDDLAEFEKTLNKRK